MVDLYSGFTLMIYSDWHSWHMTVLLTCSVLSCDPPHSARAQAAKLEMLAKVDLQDNRNT